MKHVKKSVLLSYSPHEMYMLVTDVEHYPDFLPWASASEVIERTDTGVTARIHLSYLGVRQAFTTRNEQVADQSVSMRLVDGPFSVLDGDWRFIALPAGEGPQADACKVEFELNYSFASKALDLLISPMFDRITNTFVESFVKRAEQVYGKR